MDNSENSGWTDSKELLLRKNVEQCKIYKWMHGKSNKYYKKMDKRLGIPAIFFGALSGITTFGTINTENPLIINIVIGCVILFSTILTALQNFLNYNQLAERHSTSSKQYAILTNTIMWELIRERDERSPAIEFITNLNEQTNLLIQNSPEIPEIVWKNFMKDIEDGIVYDETGKNILNSEKHPIEVIVKSDQVNITTTPDENKETEIEMGNETETGAGTEIEMGTEKEDKKKSFQDSELQKAFDSAIKRRMPHDVASHLRYQMDRWT